MELDRGSTLQSVSGPLLKLQLFSLSKKHKNQPWGMDVNGQRYEVGYWPADSRSGMFGGNSNWRGPICIFSIVLLASIFAV
jgi:hypothetical protein